MLASKLESVTFMVDSIKDGVLEVRFAAESGAEVVISGTGRLVLELYDFWLGTELLVGFARVMPMIDDVEDCIELISVEFEVRLERTASTDVVLVKFDAASI